MLSMKNKKKKAEREKILAQFKDEDDEVAWLKLGDQHPDFRYNI